MTSDYYYSLFTNSFLTIVGVGTTVPAILLFAGLPDSVCSGLGRPFPEWTKSPESKFGLYLYTVSDLCLGGLIIATSYLASTSSDGAAAGFGPPGIASGGGGGAATTTTPAGSISRQTLALGATAVHQYAYLIAAIPTMGFRKEHIGSIVFGTIAAILAFWN